MIVCDCVNRQEVDCCFCSFFLIGSNGTHLVVHSVVPFDGGGKERPIVLSLRLKVMDVATIFHGIVCDVGHADPTWM